MPVTRTNGIICPTPSAWAQSGTHLAVPFGRLLQIYDVSTSPPKCIVTASPHESTISTVVGLPGMQFASSSHDSTVKLWDVLEGQCLRTIDIGSAILDMCAIPGALLCVTKHLLIWREIEPPYKAKTIMARPFPESTRVSASSDGSVVALIVNDNLFLFSLTAARDQIDDEDNKNNNINAQAPLGTGQKPAAVHLVSKQHRIVKNPPHLKVKFDGMLHSVAVSASAKHLVVGGNTGMIYYISEPFRLVQNMNKNHHTRYMEISPTHLHWHSSPVQALHFTHEDTNLLSGGQEGVLVNWNLTSYNFGSNNFLPLIGAPILAISVSPDESQYALSLCDNSAILVEQSERKLQSVIRSIACRIEMDARTRITKIASRDDGHHSGYRMVVCKSSNAGCVFVANDNTRIQEFNALCGEHVRNISVVPMNEIFEQSRNTLSTVTVSRVTHVAMHPNGSFLASIDLIDRQAEVDPSLHNLRRNTVTTLRVWRRDEHDGWSLCSVVVNPHGHNNSVISLLFHPVSNVLLTTGSDNKVKLWRATVLDQGKNTRPQVGTWRCELSKTYRNKRCESACFSDDGSVLALGCENVVALWTITDLLQRLHDNNKDGSNDVDVGNANVNSKIAAAAAAGLVMFEAECSLAVEFCAILMHPSSFGVEATIQGLQFIMGPIPVFVAASTHGVYVWNALTHDLVWSFTVATKPSTLCIDPTSGRFAIAVHVSPITSSLPMPMSMPGHRRNHHHHLGVGMHEGHTTPATRIENIGAVTNVGSAVTMMNVDQVTTAVKSKKKNKNKKNGTATTTEPSAVAVRSVSKREKPKLANHMALESRVHDNPTAVAIFDSICPVPVHVHQLAPRVGVSSLTFVESDPSSVNTGGETASGEEQLGQGGQRPHDVAARNDDTAMNDDGAGNGTTITFGRKEHHQHQHQHTLVCIDTNLEVSLIRGGADNGDKYDNDHHLDVDISLTSDEPLNSAAVGAVLDNTTLGHNGSNTTISSTTTKADTDAAATGKLDSLFGQQWREDAAAVQRDALNTAGVAAEGTEEVTDGVIGAMPRKPNHSLLEQAFDDFLTGPVHAQAPVSVQSCEFLKALLSIPGELAVTGSSKGLRGDNITEDGQYGEHGVDILGMLANGGDNVGDSLPNGYKIGRSNTLNRLDSDNYNGEAHGLEGDSVDDNNDNEDGYDMSGEAMLKFCQRLTEDVNMKDEKESHGPTVAGKPHGQTKNSGIKPSHTPRTATVDVTIENKKSNGKNKNKAKRISDSGLEPSQPLPSGSKPTPKERARDIVRSSSGKNRLNHGHSRPGSTGSAKGRDVRSPGKGKAMGSPGPSGPSAKKKRLQQRRSSLLKSRPNAD